jgi:hypothetical protein
MNNPMSSHFYLFKGDWYDRFVELIELIHRPNKFSIWESQNRHKGYNIAIVSGEALPSAYCLDNNFWKTDQKTFEDFYKHIPHRFNIYNNYNPETGESADTENRVSRKDAKL